jgi:hypothetical protein
MKQTYTIYVISCYSRLKTRFKFSYASYRANIYEYLSQRLKLGGSCKLHGEKGLESTTFHNAYTQKGQ